MAATTGLLQCSICASTVLKIGSVTARGVPNSVTSAPAENALSLPVSTMPRMPGSASAVARVEAMRWRMARPRLLKDGLLSVMTATGPWHSTRKVFMGRIRGWGGGAEAGLKAR